jgi:hypothetical protein
VSSSSVRRTVLEMLALSFLTAQADRALAATPAFPEAEGFGALVTGGRGYKVVHVTSLSDSGAGSLRDAMSQGNRIVVFDVGGVITLASKLAAGGDNMTIAGQTAPGDGITVYGNGTSFSSRKNIVVRFVRFRQGLAKDSAEGTKAVNLTDAQNMIFDHVSVQWGRWDGFGITGDSSTVTVQDSIIGESIVPQKFGGLVDSADQITLARNLWIDNESRNPKFKANGQYINNVVYNWGGGGGLIGGHSSADWYEDVINNYFIAGPANTGSFLSQYASTDRVFHQGNLVDVDRDGKLGGRAVADADFKGDTPPTFERAAHNRPSVPVAVLTPQAAYESIAAQAGVCQRRDTVDRRLIDQLRSLGTSGAILAGEDGEAAVGGQPAVAQSQRPADFDTDRDGMPDDWESAHGLDPSNAADATADATGDGYTNVEKYLNELASSACGGSPPMQPDAGADALRDAAAADGVRADTTDGVRRDAGVADRDAASDPAGDTSAPSDASPSSPDGRTSQGDASAPSDASPETNQEASDATLPTDARPNLDRDAASAETDVNAPRPDATTDSVSAGASKDAASASEASANGCTCTVASARSGSPLPWLLLGLASLLCCRRRWRWWR